MKGLLRPLLVSGLSAAIALTGLVGGHAEAAGNAAPTSLAVVPSATSVFEGDLLTLTVQLDSAATEQIRVEANWGDPSTPDWVFLNTGDRQVVFGHTYLDDGVTGTPQDLTTITVRAENAATSLSASVEITVKNAPPTFTSLTVSPSTIQPGQTATIAGAFADAGTADRHSVTVDWGDNVFSAFPRLIAKTYTFSYSHLYRAAGTHTITARVTDDDTGWVEATIDLTVGATNSSPSDLVLAMSPVAEGGSSTLTASFTDPDASDAHNATVNWGDLSGVDVLPTLAAGVTSFSPAHTYKDTGSYTVTVVLNDSAGHAITGTTPVSVSNVAPSVSLAATSSPIEGDNFDLSGTFTDPGTADTFTLSVDWGDPTAKGAPVLGADGRSFTASHIYAVEGSYQLTVVVTDRDGAFSTASATVVVLHRNVPPTSLTLSAPAVTQGALTTVTGAFSDADVSDAHSVVMSWGDGTASATLSLASGVTSFTTTHGYATAGTWTVSATVTDQAAAPASASTSAVVTAPATTTAALVEQLTALVQSFDLDAYSERWAMRRIDALKSSLAASSGKFCGALRGLDRLPSVVRHMTAAQIAALNGVTAKLQAAAHCPTNEDETGEDENVVPTAPQPLTTPTAPKSAPKEEADEKDHNNNDENGNDKNNKPAVTSDKGKESNLQRGGSTKGASHSND